MNKQNPCKKNTNKGKGEVNAPEAGLRTPDANVGLQGQCLVPPHPESVRADTGEPCEDGRDGGENLG